MPIDQSLIGRKGPPVTMHVERGKIREFARAIKDDDPIYFDNAHAAREAGGVVEVWVENQHGEKTAAGHATGLVP